VLATLQKAEIPQKTLEKFAESVKLNGFMALMLKPPRCPRGFGYFFIHAPRAADRDAHMRTLTTVMLTSQDLRTALVCDPLHKHELPLEQYRLWLERMSTRFNDMTGKPKYFIGGLHMASLVADEERTYPITDLPDMAKYAVARIYQEFLSPGKPAQEDKLFPFHSRLAMQNMLCRIMDPRPF
jgi:hypothetical protein